MATTKRFVAKNGLDNNGQSITNVGISGSTLTMSAAHSLTLTTSGNSTLTVPSGTATLLASGGALGTPSSGTLTNCTGLPISGITGLGTGVGTALAANVTGTGGIVLDSSPSLTTPTLGVASATSVNKVAITAPATSATLTIADGKTLTASNTLTFTGTDSSSVAFGTGGTVAYTANKLSAFAATTSSELAGIISDETGTGALVFANTPTLVTPILGTPQSGTLTNCTGLPISSGVSGLGTGVATFLATPTSANLLAAVTDETGTGTLVFSASPTFTGTINAANLTLSGDLTVNGSTTTINSTTISVDDKNIELGSVESPSNTTADGGGITLKGSTDKTFNWVNATGAWTSSEHIEIASGKSLFLKGSTSGTVTVSVPAAAGTNTFTIPAVTGTAVTTGDTGSVTNTMLAGSIANNKLANSSVTVTAGTGMSGGGAVSLGGSVTLTNAGVTSAVAGTGISVSGATGAVTITNSSPNATHTGDVTGATALTIANDAVSNAKMANMGVNTIKGRISSGTGDPEDLTASQVRSILNVADGATSNTGTVTSVTVSAGTGMSGGGTVTSSGTITLNNAGVTSNVAGTGVSVSGATGAVTISIGQAVATSSNVQFNSIGVNTSASGTAGEIRATNEITAYYSDARLKNFHGKIGNAGEKVAALNGYYFTENEVAKSLGYTNDKMQIGLSAQEVEAVLPEAVAAAPIDDKYLTVKYEKLVPLLIEAIKELQAEVAELKKNR